MDNLTHGLAGALLAQAGLRQRYGRMATVALVVGAELPDLDFLFDLGGAIFGFQHHRGITHAFAGGLGLALLAALVLHGLLRYRPFWRLVWLTSLGVLLHIWMDYLTSYGTQILLPFDPGRYTADAVFIIDFAYTGLIVTALLLSRMLRRQAQRRYGTASVIWLLIGLGLWWSAPTMTQHPLWRLALGGLGLHLGLAALLVWLLARFGRQWPAGRSLLLARCGVVALASYMGLCLINRAVAEQWFLDALKGQRAVVQQVAVLPMPGGPHRWRGIADTGKEYLVSHIDLLAWQTTVPVAVSKGPDTDLVRSTSDYRLVRVFQDFARFPVVELRQEHDGQVVRYFDLRFTGYGRNRSWFDLEVRLGPDGRVRAIDFLNRVFAPPHPEF